MSEKTVRPPRRKSTNVRLPIRAGFRLLSWLAPQRAETMALDLFSTPRRPQKSEDPEAGIAGHRFTIESGGRRLAAWDWGRGPTVILTHGWSGHSGQMAAFVGPLVKAGYYVVAFDHPAHGQSEGTRTNYLEVAAAVTAVARRVGPVHAIIGHSFGCLATILALTRGLPVERAVLVAPPPDSPAYARGFGRIIGLTEARVEGMVDRIRVRLGGDLAALDARQLVKGLRTRALVIHDRGDREAPFAQGAALAANWPDAQLEPTEGLGHNRVLRDPGVVARAVEFVEGRMDVVARPALSLVR